MIIRRSARFASLIFFLAHAPAFPGESLWFSGISPEAQRKRSELFESKFKESATALKMDDATTAMVAGLSADARYAYCQQLLYYRLLGGSLPKETFSITDKPYPEWPPQLQVARKDVFWPQLVAKRKELQDGGELVQKVLDIKDIEFLSNKMSHDDLLIVLLALPDDFNLFVSSIYAVEALHSNGARPLEKGALGAANPPPPNHPSVSNQKQMDATTAQQVQLMVAVLESLFKKRREGLDYRPELEKCELLVADWNDNPLLASYFQLLGDYYRCLYLDTSQDAKLREKYRGLHRKALAMYGDCVCVAEIALTSNSCEGVDDFVCQYVKLWAFYSDRGGRVYPIREIQSYMSRNPKDYPSPYFSAEEIETRARFIRANEIFLKNVENNILSRIEPGKELVLPEELAGSPLWQRLKGDKVEPESLGPAPVHGAVSTPSANEGGKVAAADIVPQAEQPVSTRIPSWFAAWGVFGIVLLFGLYLLYKRKGSV